MPEPSEIHEFSGIASAGIAAIKAILSRVLANRKYNPKKTAELTDEVTSTCLEKMKEVSSNFKYIVSCVVIQKKGAGLHMETAAHWDIKTDGDFVVREENDTMTIVVTVYGLGIV